jgi:hypothetical protein
MRAAGTAASAARSSTGASLDALLAARVLPRSWPARILAACELPSHFERCARDLAPDLAWRAYGEAERPLFVVARAHPFERGPPEVQALDVYFLDGRAVVYRAGVWAHRDWRGWRRIDKDHD